MRFRKIIFLGLGILSLGLTSCNKEKELVGFDIDLAKELGQRLGVDVQFQEIVWEQKEIELASKNIDLIWNGLTITKDRSENLELSIPYLVNKQVLVSKDSTIDFTKNLKVSFEAGSAGEDLFNRLSDFSNMTKVALSAQVDALTEILSNTSDVAIIDSTMAGFYINANTSYKDLNIIDYETESEYYGIAARKGEKALINKVNELLTDMYYSKKSEEIAAKYGLADYIVNPLDYDTNSTDDSLNYILNKKSLIIGYTIFAPIAYKD